MTREQFAGVCGADPKWIENTVRLLDLDLKYTASEGKRLGLVHLLQAELHVTLAVAAGMADRALADGNGTANAALTCGISTVTIDVQRYLSNHAARLAAARHHMGPRQRGRPPARRGSAVARARDYGLDIGLLRSALSRSPGERIRLLSDNVELVKRLGSRAP